MSPYIIGSLFGSIVLTGLVSRILDKYTFKNKTLTEKALFVSLITLGICTLFGMSKFGFFGALLQYGAGVLVWLILDMFRAQSKKERI